MCLAIHGHILSTAGDHPLLRTERVSFGGIVKEIRLAYTPEANVGDYVIVHVGFAISALDKREARASLNTCARSGNWRSCSSKVVEAGPRALRPSSFRVDAA